MRTLDFFVLDGDWVFEQVLYREILRTARRVLSSKEYDSLLTFVQKPRRRMPKHVEKAVAKLRVALGVE